MTTNRPTPLEEAKRQITDMRAELAVFDEQREQLAETLRVMEATVAEFEALLKK